jgi:transposase
MDYYAGIDVSLEQSSVCVLDGEGKIIREAKVASEPEALIAWFGSLGLAMTRIGLEAGPLSQWLFAAMKQAGLPVELLETRHVRNAFKTMPVKTDRKDARGIAELMRMGWFRPVHCKSISAQETRAILTTRTLIEAKPNGSRSWSASIRIYKSSPMRCWLYAKCCCASSGVSRSAFGRWRDTTSGPGC